MIQAETQYVSRYAPVEVNTYRCNGEEGMSLGRLVMAVCCRRAAAIENQSVLAMNRLTGTSAWLEAISSAGKQIFTCGSLDETADMGGSGYECRATPTRTPTLKEFLQYECGVDAGKLSVSSADARMALFGEIRTKIDSAASQSQQETIDLQSLVSRRDVTYNASAATARAMNASALATAAALR